MTIYLTASFNIKHHRVCNTNLYNGSFCLIKKALDYFVILILFKMWKSYVVENCFATAKIGQVSLH